jgi:Uma2 family endonuclease
MATSALISVGEYLKTTYDPDAEYVDGTIEERPMGEYDHSTWQGAVLQWFQSRAKEWNIRSRVELRIQVSPTRYRVADVVVVDRGLPVEQILTHPPIAIVEVLSPEDSLSRVLVKLADYERMGILTILVVDPKTRSFYQYEKGSLELSPQMQVQLAGSDAIIDWDRVTEMLD